MNRIFRVLGPLVCWVFAAGCSARGASPGPSKEKPQFVRLSLLGEGRVGIAWSTLAGPPATTVEYARLPDGTLQRREAQLGPALPGGLGRVSELALGPLEPNTHYRYRVGRAPDGFSPWHHFRVPPPRHSQCGTLRVAFAADTRAEKWQRGRGSALIWPALLLRIAARRPDLLLHGGDLVHRADDARQWLHTLDVNALVSADLPIMPTIGNHDDGPGQGDAAIYNRLFVLPRAESADGGSGTEDFYALRYGHALIISLSSETFTADGFVQQSRWLERRLRRSDALWKIVVIHRPLYTYHLPLISHRPDEAGMLRAVGPILGRHSVDLVLAGHNHFYERFVPSRCPAPRASQLCPVESGGTVFITSGGGGAFPIFYPGPTSAQRLAAYGGHHYLDIRIDDGVLQLQVIDRSERIRDRLTLSKPVSCGG